MRCCRLKSALHLYPMSSNMNKSSSFYSEAYYQKARKDAFKKKPIYRERNKQLYDQEHELDILRYYTNRSGRCEMIRYYELIAELFFVMREKNIKGSDQYNETVTEYVARINEKIKYFHEFLQCDEYETRQQRELRIKQEAGLDAKDEELNRETAPERPLPTSPSNVVPLNMVGKAIEGGERQPRRLDTCNQCPIFIEEYEVNFEKTITTISKQSSYWDKLNGNQKLAKFRRYVEQNLKILKYELENKCEFASKGNRKLGRRMFGRP